MAQREGDRMSPESRPGTSRRTFLKAAGLGAAGTVAVGAALRSGLLLPASAASTTALSLVASDGYMSLPGREGDPVYIFGFVPVDPTLSVDQLVAT
jgi:hypothetical protein